MGAGTTSKPRALIAPVPYRGVLWLAVLIFEGLRVRLAFLCYRCPGCGAFHLYTGF